MKSKLFITFTLAALGFIFMTSASTRVAAFSCNWAGGGGTNDWSDSSNWVGTCAGGAGVPIDGDDVGLSNNISTNNDIVGLSLNSLTFFGSPGGTLTGNALGITTSINGSFPHIISPAITLLGNASFSTNAYNGGINVNGFTLTSGGGVRPWGISGPLQGTGTIVLDGVGSGAGLNNGGTYTGDIVISGMSQVSLGLGFSNVDVSVTNGSVLNLSGPVRSVTTDGFGTVSPYDGVLVGKISSVQDITLQSGDTAGFRIASAGTAGQNYDTLEADTVNLGGATLSLTLDPGYTSTGLDVFTLASSTTSLTGTFNGLPEGSLITVGTEDFIIHYTATTVDLQAVGGQIFTDNPSFTANPSSPGAGQSVTITAVIGSNFQMPTGTAEFFDGATSLGVVVISGGNAVITIPGGFTSGSHSITFIYSGDILHGAFISNPLVLSVAGLANTGINLPLNLIAIILFFALMSGLTYKRFEK